MPILRDTLGRLGLKQNEFARLIRVNPRTVSLWATGSAPLPGPVSAYLRLLQAVGPGVIAGEIDSLDDRDRMLDEGVYGLSYRSPNGPESDGGTALAVLRNGKIIGSDRQGGVFSGSYEFDPAGGKNRMHLRLTVPPHGTLVTGFTAGPEGASLDIVAEFERAIPVSTVNIGIAGLPVEIQLSYLGPLPN